MVKTHLNKIVEYLLEDIKINYLHSTVEILDGSNRTYDVEFLSNGFFSTVWDILEFDYGLNSDDCLYVYGNLLFQINKKIKLLGSINESVDNKEIYIDKISQYILDDTELDYEQKLVTYPFIPNINSQWGLSTPLYYATIESPLFNEFSEYCNDTYGLTYEESVYVWDQYKVIFNHKINSKPMNESVDSKKIYLDKIVQYIIDDTIIDYEEREIKYPYFSNILLLTPNKQQHLPLHSFRAFSIYCENMYGLHIEEIQYVWYHYMKNSELF